MVLEKDPETYARILRQLDVAPQRFCMVGNSVRSDILPVLGLGGHAVHIPYPLLWEHEHVDHDEDLDELASIKELPAALRADLRTYDRPMDRDQYLASYRRDSRALLDAIRARPVRTPRCPTAQGGRRPTSPGTWPTCGSGGGSSSATA